MYHSITFIDVDDATKRVNTWEDWHLVPSSRPVIVPPKVQTKYVDIPGADGSLDLTDYLAGRPTFANREGTIDFTVLNNYNIEGYEYVWSGLYSDIMDYLHGKRKLMILEDDPVYYYQGRFSVDSWATDQHNSKITIGYNLWPYKTATHLFIGSRFEYGEYDVTEHPSGSPNHSLFNGPKLSNSQNRSSIREKILKAKNYVDIGDFAYVNGTVISFNPSSEYNSYQLNIYQYYATYWRYLTTLNAGDTYTVNMNLTARFRFTISSGGTDIIPENKFSYLASCIQVTNPASFEPTEVL